MKPVRWLTLSQVADVLKIHDAHLAQLKKWKELFTGESIVGPFAAFLADRSVFPDAPRASAATFEKMLRDDRDGIYNGGKDVFDPWTSWWIGDWGGKKQYHIWDGTESDGNGQYVQPVTQSETAHVSRTNHAYLSSRWCANLAVNVFSPGNGITGWVTKQQTRADSGAQYLTQLPHLGFSLPEHKLLVWITKEYANPSSGSLGGMAKETSFWVFLEYVESDTYHIRGRIDVMYNAASKTFTSKAMGGKGDYKVYSHVRGAVYPDVRKTRFMPDPGDDVLFPSLEQMELKRKKARAYA
jgi:hypothetical protein